MDEKMNDNEEKGEMSVREAGQKGGSIGGKRTAETHGHEFYQEIGSKGGQKVKRLVEEGQEMENKSSQSRDDDY